MNARSGVAVELRPSADPDLPALAGVFGLLADPGRLRILLVLRSGEANVGQLSASSGLSESATSHALRLLRAQRVVRVRRTGRLAIYSLADEHVRDLLDIAMAHAEHAGGHVEHAGGHAKHPGGHAEHTGTGAASTSVRDVGP